MKKNNSLDKWFDYMNQFDENCNTDWLNSEQCSKNIANNLGIT